mmetsp:Transcript_31496/g.67041  ORF Transcript_31496/g.67041 Transcript_31496/m.67041 type:complete len:309 (+) Transcript_31496:486-1412(+)
MLVDWLHLLRGPREHHHARRHELAEGVGMWIFGVDAAVHGVLGEGDEGGVHGGGLEERQLRDPIQVHPAFHTEHREVGQQIMALQRGQVIDLAVHNEGCDELLVGSDNQGADQPGNAVVGHNVVLHGVHTTILQYPRETVHDVFVIVHRGHSDTGLGGFQRHAILAIFALPVAGADRKHAPFSDRGAPRAVALRHRRRHPILLLVRGRFPSSFVELKAIALLQFLGVSVRNKRPEQTQRLVGAVHETQSRVDGIFHFRPVWEQVFNGEFTHTWQPSVYIALEVHHGQVHAIDHRLVDVAVHEQRRLLG